MSLISVNHLSFCYEGGIEPVFEDVSFQIDTNWKLGLTGRNGRGKTTLLHILEGKYEYTGTITGAGEMDYFPFEITDPGQDTIVIAKELDPDYEIWKICRELSFLDVDSEVLYRPFDSLSGGEQTKVMLAVLFSRDNHFLLIDEPTNHLDMEAREQVMQYLKRKKGFILVSHDRHFLDGCVDHILAINPENIEVTRGNFSTWQSEKEKRDVSQQAENEKLKKDIRRLEEAARRTEGWSDAVERTKTGSKIAGLRPDRGAIGHKAAKMMKRSKSIENRRNAAAEEKKKLLKNVEHTEELKLYPLTHHKQCLVAMEDVTLAYGNHEVCRGWDLKICQNERILLQGPNGCGKSSILKAVLEAARWKEDDDLKGQEKEESRDELKKEGKIETAAGLIISYVPQTPSGLEGTLKEYADRYDLPESTFLALLRKMDFSRMQFEKRLEDYSMGQKKKVLIAKSLCEQAHLYIWDEPMNYIDIFSRQQIIELIRKYQPTMLLVEHDYDFVRQVAVRTVTVP